MGGLEKFLDAMLTNSDKECVCLVGKNTACQHPKAETPHVERSPAQMNGKMLGTHLDVLERAYQLLLGMW